LLLLGAAEPTVKTPCSLVHAAAADPLNTFASEHRYAE